MDEVDMIELDKYVELQEENEGLKVIIEELKEQYWELMKELADLENFNGLCEGT